MKKVISLFKRDYEGNRLVYDEVVEGAEWVIEGEGVATEKIDGTSCMIRDGKLYKRYDAKKGKTPSATFIPAQAPDPITGHWPGWVPIGDGPEDRWHREAIEGIKLDAVIYRQFRSLNWPPDEDVTVELIGPKVQWNKYGLSTHIIRPHGDHILWDAPYSSFDAIKKYLEDNPQYEGIVWWHIPLDGRLVKIKRKDFGLKW